MLALALVIGPGCSKSDDSTPKADSSGAGPSAAATPGAKPITVGFLYVGTKDDYGYNESHAQGAAAVKAMPGVKVVEVESVKETKDCQDAMESMINLQGATLIFPTSFGYFDPHVLAVAPKYPAVTFLHAGGQYKDGMPKNVGTYFAYIDELEYLCGMTAGMTSKSNKLGYIAAKPITPVLRDINAFELGAKSVNPKATTYGDLHGRLVHAQRRGKCGDNTGRSGDRRCQRAHRQPQGDDSDGRQARYVFLWLSLQRFGAVAQDFI